MTTMKMTIIDEKHEAGQEARELTDRHFKSRAFHFRVFNLCKLVTMFISTSNNPHFIPRMLETLDRKVQQTKVKKIGQTGTFHVKRRGQEEEENQLE